jgi:hypothetical protein
MEGEGAPQSVPMDSVQSVPMDDTHSVPMDAADSGPVTADPSVPMDAGPTNLMDSAKVLPSAQAIASRDWLNNPPIPDITPYTADLAAEGARQMGSAVATLTAPLSWPARLETAAVVKAASLLGVPRGKELEATLNPGHRWFPDAYLSDVLDFYDDRSPTGQAAAQAAQSVRMAYYSTRAGIGLGINVLLDPLNLFTVGTYTRAAKELQRVGNEINPLTDLPRVMDAAAKERNLLAVKVPLSGGKEIPLVAMKTASPLIDGLKKVPGVDTLASFLRRLSPDTGYADVDLTSSTHAALGRGQAEQVLRNFVIPNNALKFSPEEESIVAKLVEKTPNMAPNLPAKVLKAAGPKLGGTEAGIRGQMAAILEEAHDVAPGRAESLIEAAMRSKKMGAAYLESSHRIGFLDETNVAQKVIENHLPHVVDPAYRDLKLKGKTATQLEAEILAKQKDLENKATQVIKGSYLKYTDPTRYRSMSRGMTLPEANAHVMAEHGVKDFFVTDPVKASAIRLLEVQKLERDKVLLDTVARYGVRPGYGMKAPEGYATINHPAFNDKTVIIKEGGETKKLYLRDVVFPKPIAEKMSYYINPPAVGNAKAQMNALNRIFRSTSFFSPGFWVRNSADNTLKNIVQGVTSETHLDTLKLFTGKLSGLKSEGNILAPKGKLYSSEELTTLLAHWGITSASAFRDGVGDFMNAGKKLTLSQAASSPRQMGIRYTAQVAESMLHGVSQFGERGENFTRAALFIQRLKEGYTPEMAAREVTKYLFDYTRNSPTTDSLRFFFPFIQHPIKTLLVAPELVGSGLRGYNTVHNTFPHVLAAAFNDPITQDELNQIMPAQLRSRDAIAGPLLTGNTMIADLFKNPKTPGSMGSLVYFDGAIGMRILNHFNYFSQEASVNNWGLSPVWGALVRGFAIGKDNFGRDLDEATVGRHDWANRVNFMISSALEGTFAFHNSWAMMKHAFGIGDPKYFEPATVSIMKGAFGQFGGVTNLDRDFFFKTIALSHERAELVKNLRVEVGREVRNFSSASSLVNYVRSAYGVIEPETPLKIYKNLQAKMAEIQGHEIAAGAIQGKIDASTYAARIKAIDETLKNNNRAYQFSIQRYLDMAKGTKNANEARAASGVGK